MIGKKGENKVMFALGVILVAIVALNVIGGKIQFGATTPTVTQSAGTPSTSGTPTQSVKLCPSNPTIQLASRDKYESSVVVDNADFVYKLNGGAITTDSDGSFTGNLGDTIQFLVAGSTTGNFTPEVVEYKVSECVNTFPPAIASRNATVTLTCYNSSNVVGGQVVGSGEAVSGKCDMKIASLRGFPLGGVLVADLNKSAYRENEIRVDGLPTLEAAVQSKLKSTFVADATSAHTIAGIAAVGAAKGYAVGPILDAKTYTFNWYLPAENGVNPTTGGSNLTFSFYPNACYREEDVSPEEVRCGTTDLDNAFVKGGFAGQSVIDVS